ncbi:TP53INP1 family protein [Megaselia abdita]
MFSSLASYLFGSSSTTADTPNDTNPITTTEETTENKQLDISIVKKKSKKNKKRNNKQHCDKKNKNLTSDESDDDWLFIEREDEEESLPRTDSEEDHTVVEIKTSAAQRNLRRHRNKNKRLQSPGRTSSPVRDYDAVSQSMHVVPELEPMEPVPSANNSLVAFGDTTLAIPANLSMEESWFLTPPPIFTSTGPINIELSPFENLLIEHPSMSVYHSIRSAQEATESFVNLDLGIEVSQSPNENHHSVLERSPENAPNAVQQRNGNRVDRLSNNQDKETILFRKSQKVSFDLGHSVTPLLRNFYVIFR